MCVSVGIGARARARSVRHESSAVVCLTRFGSVSRTTGEIPGRCCDSSASRRIAATPRRLEKGSEKDRERRRGSPSSVENTWSSAAVTAAASVRATHEAGSVRLPSKFEVRWSMWRGVDRSLLEERPREKGRRLVSF